MNKTFDSQICCDIFISVGPMIRQLEAVRLCIQKGNQQSTEGFRSFDYVLLIAMSIQLQVHFLYSYCNFVSTAGSIPIFEAILINFLVLFINTFQVRITKTFFWPIKILFSNAITSEAS